MTIGCSELAARSLVRCALLCLRASMKFHTEYLKFHTRKHREYIHITPRIESIVRNSGIN